MILRAWLVLRRDPLLLVLLVLALGAPAYLGLLPLDQALAPLLDLSPVARALGAVKLDDTLTTELTARAPSLAGTLVGGVLVALLLGTLAVWLVEAAIAAAALRTQAPVRFVVGRCLGVSLLALPLRALPGLIAVLVWHTAHAPTWVPLRDALIVAALLYAIASAKITVLVDLARGHAIVDDGGLVRALLDGARTAWGDLRAYTGLVLLELASFGFALGVLALTRPLGLFHGVLWIAGVAALGVRALVAALVVAASATGAAARSA